MKKLIISLAIMFALYSCEPDNRVKFETPQPESVKEIDHFRLLRRGVYVNYKSPKKKIEIKKDIITTSTLFQFTVDRNTVEISKLSDVDRQNDSSLIAYFEKLGGDVKIEGDDIHYSQTLVDTIFLINETHILKHYKRSYYLNFRANDSLWTVYRMKFHGDTLLYGEITPSDTLLKYDYTKIDSSMTKSKAKAYILNPDKKELRKLMRSNAFKFTEKYIKE